MSRSSVAMLSNNYNKCLKMSEMNLFLNFKTI